MKTVVSVLFVLFVLPTVCTIALADAVPGALLYFDARDNRAHPGAWTNHGTVGGELSGAGNSPVLEEGTIAIPALILIPSRGSIPTGSPVSAGAAKVTASNYFSKPGPSNYFSE